MVDDRAVTCNFVIVELKDGADRAAVAAIQDGFRGARSSGPAATPWAMISDFARTGPEVADKRVSDYGSPLDELACSLLEMGEEQHLVWPIFPERR